jgi:hypothetical protein
MPAGTERLLNILENAIDERNDSVSVVGKLSEKASAAASSVKVVDVTGIQTGWTLSFGGDDYKVGAITGNSLAITPALKAELPAGTRFFANKDAPPAPMAVAAGPKPTATLSVQSDVAAGNGTMTVTSIGAVAARWTFTSGGNSYTVSNATGTTITFTPNVPTGSTIPAGNVVFTAP